MCVCCCGSGAAALLEPHGWRTPCGPWGGPVPRGRCAIYWKFERRVAERGASSHALFQRRTALAEEGEDSQLPIVVLAAAFCDRRQV